ncbi:MAG: outer membrane beta-barrel protein [Vicinamibacteria bacterium]
MMSAVLCAGRAQAQNVLMNSAETINPGNFKIAAFPTLLFGKDGADNETGIAGRFGYGFTDRFDMEGKLAFFDGVTLYGLDAEYWLLKGPADVSVSLGAHKTSSDFVDSSAIDTALLVSGNIGDKLEAYGGLNLSFESLDDIDDSSFTRAYVVPGIEYKIHDDLDLVAEFGIGLNDDSPHYVSAGLAFYIR